MEISVKEFYTNSACIHYFYIFFRDLITILRKKEKFNWHIKIATYLLYANKFIGAWTIWCAYPPRSRSSIC